MTDDPTGAPLGLVARLDATGLPLALARLLVGATMISLGAAKVGDPVAFLKLIREYQLIPESLPWLLNGMASLLPWLEIWCGLLLIAGLAVRGAALVATALLAVFTGAILLRALGIMEAEGLALCAIKFDCGCGSGEEWVCTKLPQNLGLILAALVALVSRSRRFCLRHTL